MALRAQGFRRFLGLSAIAVLAFCLGCIERDTPLAPGLIDVVSLARGESRFYRAPLHAGDVLHLRIEQRGLDVEIRSGDRPPVDLPYGGRVPEDFWWLAERTGDLRVEVRSLGGVGDYRLSVERFGTATGSDRRQAEAFWLARRGVAAASASPVSSVAPLEEALALLRAPPPLSVPAVLWGDLGRARLDAGDGDGALAAFDEAAETVDRSLEPALVGRLIHARGRALRRAWHLDRAAADYDEARILLERAGDVYGQILVVNDLAVLADLRGDLQAACDGYRRAGQLFAESGSARGRATAQLNLGRCLMKRGSMAEALPTLLAALRWTGSEADAVELRAGILREIGWWHRLQRQPDQALSFLAEAHELQPGDSGVLDRLATVHLDRGELETARVLYSQALGRTGSDRLGEAHVRTNLCRLAEIASRHEGHRRRRERLVRAGLEQCRQALAVFEAVGATGTSATVLFLTARLERRRNRLAVAEALAARALSRIESQRTLAGGADDRTSFLAERQEFYRLLIELRMELHDRLPLAGWDARALEVFELTRARSLLDLLAAEDVDPSLQLSPDLRWAEAEALERLEVRARDLLARARVEGRPVAGAEAELAALEADLAAVRRSLQSVDPSYVALTRPEPLDVAAIRLLLDDETLLVALHLGESRGVLWTVDRHRVTGRWLGSREEIERSAQAWYRLLADPGWRSNDDRLERRRARQVSEQLLRPIAADLGRYRRLVLVADGVLQRLPFSALPAPGAGGEDRPLVIDHEIVQLPSTAVLALLREAAAGRPEPDRLLAIVADPVYDATDDRFGEAAAAAGSHRRERRLYGSAAEAADLAALAGPGETVLLQGFAARRDSVLGGALKGFRIVHFASHARTDAAPGRPLGLLLSSLDEDARPLRDVLGLPELYALDLPADLVVLSGCATAIGREVEGEGLMGLTRGFIHAGTPRIVVSLWSVRDQAAREFMRRFYESLLRERRSPADALRRAQVAMRADGRNVRDWAAFILHGEWRPFPLAVLGGGVLENDIATEARKRERSGL